jgi:outer membrane murein-binding lipoprotein Lpp
MKKSIALGLFAVVIVLVILSAWLVNNQFNTYQTQITDLQSQNSELESQIGQLQNQTNSLENQNSQMMIQLGDLTKQLALERHLKIEIVSFLQEGYGIYGGTGTLGTYYFAVTVRNNDVVTVSGLALTVQGYFGLEKLGETYLPYEVNLLNVGEEQVVNGYVDLSHYTYKNFTYVAILKSADVVLDEFSVTLPNPGWQET